MRAVKRNMITPNREGKTLDAGYDEFVHYCKARNLSEATIKHYDESMRIVYKFMDYKTLISSLSEHTVQDFVIFCKRDMGQKDITTNTNLRSLKTILYYFMRLGYMDSFKISEIRVTKEPIETYSDAELRILLKKPDMKKASFVELRNWTITNFIMGTAIRLKSLANIKIKDIDFENELITLTHTKNRRGQIVPISHTLKAVLVEYTSYRGGEDEDYLFSTAYGGKMKENALTGSMALYNKRRGVMKTGVHRLRHTFARNWILNGGDVFRLQKILGHSSMDIVRNYVNMFSDDVQRDFNTFNPLENITEQQKKGIKLR